MNKCTGFTLIELMIAITVLAIISTMAYSGLNSVLKSHEILSKKQESFNQLIQIITPLQKEFRTIIPRPIHDKYNSLLPALKLEKTTNLTFSFTRGGIPNPSGLQKSSLQRIDYFFSEKTLIKRIWLTVDNYNADDHRDEVISTTLNLFNIEVLGFDGVWYQQWPNNKNDPPDLLPKAIKFTLALPEFGEMSRLVELPI
jgi:general secretion pathway protein J